MAFRVGQKVVCVDGSPAVGGGTWGLEPQKGSVYEIRNIGTGLVHGQPTLMFGIVELDGTVPGVFWRASRFRPVVERKTDISIFTAMLNPSKQTVDAP